jgi:predicted amidohydrolase
MKAKVAVVQFKPELAKPEDNIKRLQPLLDSIHGCQLVILPELSNSGYNFNNNHDAWQCSETIGRGGIFQDFLVDSARKNNYHIVSGINEKSMGKLFNTAILAGPEGIQGKYRKLHLFMNERDIFSKGNAGLPVFDIGGFRIGIMICFDYLFPEPWGILAQKGADLICHPSNLLTQNAQRCLPGLSLMNRVYIATANRIGTEGNISFNGSSMVTDPSGIIMKMASADETEIVITEIDTELSRNKMLNPVNHVFNDRRPDTYLP